MEHHNVIWRRVLVDGWLSNTNMGNQGGEMMPDDVDDDVDDYIDIEDILENDFKCLRPSECTAEGQLGAWCDHCEWFVARWEKP